MLIYSFSLASYGALGAGNVASANAALKYRICYFSNQQKAVCEIFKTTNLQFTVGLTTDSCLWTPGKPVFFSW